ncbi:MAG: cyclic nucleotide-binding/CBS domain-containing protein [Nitrososphaerales archaeon]
MDKKVKEVMNKDVAKIESDKSVLDAARLMADKGVGCVVITSGIKALGIVTERDLVSRVLVEPFDPSKVLVRDIATTPLFKISPDQTVKEAAELMVKYKIRRLPVVDKDMLIGIITANDLAAMIAGKTGDEDLILKAVTRSKRPPPGIYG